METQSPIRRFRRGDTSPERPGLVFLRYSRGSEKWGSASRLEEMKVIARKVNAKQRITNAEQAAMAFHYTNCQPMWSHENRAKSDFIEHNGERIRARDARTIIPFKQEAA